MAGAAAQRWVWRGRRVVVALSAIWALTLLWIFAQRVGFAMELEWMEGGVLHQALRFSEGKAIYPPPSAEFVPFLYTPLYAMVLGVLGRIVPLDFALGRAVSILCVVAAAWALAVAVRREGKPRAHAVAAVGLFASSWVFGYRWLDLARPDSMVLALLAWGLVLLRHAGRSHRQAVLAGVLVALAFWTKQTAAVFVVGSGVAALVVAPRVLATYALTIAIIDGGGVLLGNAATDGWLWTYIYELHQAHAFNRERFTTKTWGMFVHAAPWLVLLAVGLALRWAGRRRRRLPRGPHGAGANAMSYWMLIAAAAMLASALGYSTQWAEPNAFIPGVFFVALLLAVALPVGGVGELWASTLIAAQLVFAYVVEPQYQPIQKDGWAGLSRSYGWRRAGRGVPSTRERAAAVQLRAQLTNAAGSVLALHRPWWSVIAGGSGHVSSMGLTDVPPQTRREIEGVLVANVAAGAYAQIWIEGEPPAWLLGALVRRYRVQARRQGRERVRPISGWMSVAGTIGRYRRDQILLTPKHERPPPEGARVLADFEDGGLAGFTTTGRAFGGRAVRGRSGALPLPGPYGGEYLLCSAGVRGRVLDIGEAVSPAITLPERGALQMLVGTTGGRRGLSVTVALADGTAEQPLKIPKGRNRLAPVRWVIPPGWAGQAVHLRLEDASPDGALYFDDLWLVP